MNAELFGLKTKNLPTRLIATNVRRSRNSKGINGRTFAVSCRNLFLRLRNGHIRNQNQHILKYGLGKCA